MSKVIGILDMDTRYANRLMEYLKRKKRMMVQVRVFSDLENMQKYIDYNKLDVLLLGENLYPLKDLDYNNMPTVILSEDNKKREDKIVPSIYKYQSVVNIIDELITIFPDLKDEQVQEEKEDLKIYTVFSLGSGGEDEIFSYLLAKEYGNSEKVLYINLSPFTGMKEMVPNDNKGMSDLIYYVNEKVGGLKEKIERIIKKINTIDVILDVTFSTDLVDLSTEGMRALLDTIREIKAYKYCIIYINFVSAAVIELLRQSFRICITTDKKEWLHRRRDNFIKQLEWAGYEELVHKIVQLSLEEKEKDIMLKAYEEGMEQDSLKGYIKFLM